MAPSAALRSCARRTDREGAEPLSCSLEVRDGGEPPGARGRRPSPGRSRPARGRLRRGTGHRGGSADATRRRHGRELWMRAGRDHRATLVPSFLELHSSEEAPEQPVSVQSPPLALGGPSELEKQGHARGREPEPFARFVRRRTAAKGDSMGLPHPRARGLSDRRYGPLRTPSAASSRPPGGSSKTVSARRSVRRTHRGGGAKALIGRLPCQQVPAHQGRDHHARVSPARQPPAARPANANGSPSRT